MVHAVQVGDSPALILSSSSKLPFRRNPQNCVAAEPDDWTRPTPAEDKPDAPALSLTNPTLFVYQGCCPSLSLAYLALPLPIAHSVTLVLPN
jgi:hypothetical protein